MLKTLGGEQQLSNTYFNTKRRIELHFRPNDPYCHSVCGDLQPSRAVILRVKRRRRKIKPESTVQNDWQYEQEVLGVVHQTYRFLSLMDFQYLTPTPLQNSFSSVMTSSLLDEKQPLHIVPSIFSRLDCQGNYNYTPGVISKIGSRGKPARNFNGEERQEHTDTKIRKRRPSEAMGAIFSSKDVPKEPSAKLKEAVDVLCKKYQWAQDAVRKLRVLFNERPIWSRSAIVCHLHKDMKRERLNKILPLFAFYWLNGPWRALWNKYGYDPRQDPGGKMYQICDFRVRERRAARHLPILPSRTTRLVKLPVQIQKHWTNTAATIDYAEHPETEKLSVCPEDLPYTFHADKLPNARQVMYQLCDIYDNDIKDIISQNDGKEKTCHERDGWLPTDVITKVRTLMGKKVEARLEKELNDKGITAQNESESNTHDVNHINDDLSDEEESNFVDYK